MDVLSRCFRAHCLNLTVLFVPSILSQLQAQCPILMELVWWKMSCCVKSPEVKLPSEFTQDSQLETIMNKRWICCLALTVADQMVCSDYQWQSNRLKFIFSWSGWHAATNWPPALVAEWRERHAINQSNNAVKSQSIMFGHFRSPSLSLHTKNGIKTYSCHI